jgi:hypothetical protein
MRIIIQNICFFALSSDDAVNPDNAVREIEGIAAELNDLVEADKESFINFTQECALSEEEAGQPERRVEFIKSIPVSLGLIDDPEDEI